MNFAATRNAIKIVTSFLVAASLCYAQQVSAIPQPARAQQSPPNAQDSTIIVPAGTRIPLTLASPISSKERAGDSVRAAVAFPVTAGDRVAIPVGTYVEGAITKITKSLSAGPSVQIQFSTMVFANGYTAAINGKNLEARADIRDDAKPAVEKNSPNPSTANPFSGNAFGLTAPTPPPQPHANFALIAGLSVGLTAAVLIVGMLLHRRGSAGNRVLFDTGWQFDMVLNQPLSLDGASTAAQPQAN